MSSFGINVKDDYYNQKVSIGFKGSNKLFVTRPTFNNVSELKDIETTVDLTQAGEYNIEILVDRSSVEAFFLDGLFSATNLVYPHLHPKGVTLFIDSDS